MKIQALALNAGIATIGIVSEAHFVFSAQYEGRKRVTGVELGGKFTAWLHLSGRHDC
ncbi:hypothetical protein SISSUDRAFT_1052788 [Sistotremastrum suecicum HHB10207 ss-3]|uniref:Uncharacterized protein n=1 Tax=Sistotremastrum suecicum HHB10207 ss-3 TaxID=1314776 RepID=A0A165ZM18_9AGAM|nr:hypothetical protein SISSUDRAFT_1052788 [Sistotremastrum suecicum HHB10207 ss-3]